MKALVGFDSLVKGHSHHDHNVIGNRVSAVGHVLFMMLRCYIADIRPHTPHETC